MFDRGMTPEDILKEILGDLDMVITDRKEVRFHCNCSKERVERALITIDPKDIQEMIDDGKDIEVKCHFCNKAYNFTPDELKEILKASTRREDAR